MDKLWVLCLLILLSSCASEKSFQHFYNKEKDKADFAMAFPKYMAMIAIPKDSKDDVRYFTKGMKRIRVLYNKQEDDDLISSFVDFAKQRSFSPYIVAQKDGSKINLYAREDGDHIREIVLDIEADDETIIVALMGKMSKKTFANAMQSAQEQN